jgi:hypothetical protein
MQAKNLIAPRKSSSRVLAEGSRGETFKVTFRDPSTPLRLAQDDANASLNLDLRARRFDLFLNLLCFGFGHTFLDGLRSAFD